MNAVSKNIKKLRLQKNFTQEEMAEKLFVTRQTVSNWENGKSQPDIDTLISIADILNTDTTVLIYGMPESTDRKKDRIRLMIFTGALLIVGAGAYFLDHYAVGELQRYYNNAPFMLSRMFFLPLFWFFLGIVVIQCLDFWGIIKPINAKFRKAVRIAALSIVLLYSAIMIPYLISTIDGWIQWSAYMQKAAQLTESSFSYEWSYPIPVLNEISAILADVVIKQPVIFIIPGLIFRLFKPAKPAK